MTRILTINGARVHHPDPGAAMYAISAEAQFIKFGFATNTSRRVSELQVGSPLKLKLLAELVVPDQQTAFGIERLMHLAAARYYVRGEWFKSCPKTLAIADVMRRLELADFENLMRQWAQSEVRYSRELLNSPTVSVLGRLKVS